MLPVPEVTDVPSVCLNSNDVAHFHPEVFSTCVVTRARSAKAMEQVDLFIFLFILYFSRKVPLRLREISSSRESWPRWPY